jgi:hypothetical protein
MNFWIHHGWLELMGLALFLRVTLLVGSFATGGLLWWIGWLVSPHLLVAILSLKYWETNPALVGIAWVGALVGTSGRPRQACKAAR